MTNATLRKSDTDPALGPLAALRLTEVWQAALLMPSGHTDLHVTRKSFTEALGAPPAVLKVTATAPASTGRGVKPYMRIPLRSESGECVNAVVFGDFQQWRDALPEGRPVHVLLRVLEEREQLSVRLLEVPTQGWIGRVRPHYATRGSRATQAAVRGAVMRLLPRALGVAATHIEQTLAPLGEPELWLSELGAAGWTIAQLLSQAHVPDTPEYGVFARGVLEEAAALQAHCKLEQQRSFCGTPNPIRCVTTKQRQRAFPFDLTLDQEIAIRDISAALDGAAPIRHLIVGEVGSGKTAVYGVVAAAAADAGARVAILLPTSPLASQIHRELSEAFPDIAIARVVGGQTSAVDPATARIVIGTSALVSRDIGRIDVLVVDEEQRFGTALKSQAAPYTHRISVSATCIPRSQALARYGVLGVSVLGQSHCERDITTTMHGRADNHALREELEGFVRDGHQVLVVYPKLEDAAPDSRTDVEAAVKAWELLHPGRVCSMTGSDTDEAKTAAIERMLARQADILVATTVVEVGLTLPGLRAALVVSAERMGLSTLHQIRGRLARTGGAGRFMLYSRDPLNEKSRQRLQVLCDTSDGFAIAERDLALRGAGDLGLRSTRQSGADEGFLFGLPISMDTLERVRPLYDVLAAKTPPVRA